jgi:hypothetical protein
MFTKEATQHDIRAIAKHPLEWTLLTRGPNSEAADGSEALAARGWYRNLPQCQAKNAGQDCDEYPFYSTIQGGPARDGFPVGDIEPIDATDNRRQGAILNGFYRGQCNVNQGVSFLVVAIDSDIVPTFGYCPRL